VRRVWSGPFDAKTASLDQLDTHAKTDALDHLILPLEAGLIDCRACIVLNRVSPNCATAIPPLVMGDVEYGEECWADHAGQAIAVGTFKSGELHWRISWRPALSRDRKMLRARSAVLRPVGSVKAAQYPRWVRLIPI
jgi:hypothetical protein